MITRLLLCFVLSLAYWVAPAGAQANDDRAALWERKKLTLLLEQSQRHLEYGLELRKQGMTTQAAAEIILAAEIGKGKNPGATQVLYVMRQYDAAFWKRFGSRASPGKVESYDKKARGLLATEERETLELANWANSHKLEREAQEFYVELLLNVDEPLSFDPKSQITLAAGTIPKDASAKLREQAITINGKLYVRDELLAKLPALTEIFEVSSSELRVRTTTTLEAARDLHAVCSSLLPFLALDMGAKSQRRFSLLVFGKRAEFDQTLDALNYSEHKIVSGIASYSPFVALVCAEGLPPETVRAVCLHELTHSFAQAVSRSIFPAWFTEGFAETFGGAETFTWDGTRLEVGGMFPRSRLDALKREGALMPLAELIVADQFVQWKRSKEAGFLFYAESWALLRYLRTGAGAEIAARFEEWETRCIGQALGFELGVKRSTQSGPASQLFSQMFAKDLPKLEIGFQAWLKEI